LLDKGAIWSRDEVESCSHRCLKQGGIANRRQINPDYAVTEAVSDVLGNSEGQPGLAHATWTGERQERCCILEEMGPARSTLTLSADEAGPGQWDRIELKWCGRGTHARSQPDPW
jgi:hypothetical protein